VIQPFRLSDLFLVQRLQRQATRLNVTQAIFPYHAPYWSALTAVKPWDYAGIVTYVLHQNGHGLARAGFLQAQRRANRPEADILLLAPALDTRTGHPAVWEKLLAHYVNEAAQHQTQRIYADVPDQPLLESTFAHVGFRTYTRQTVWRLNAGTLDGWSTPNADCVRPQSRQDEWGLIRLYGRTTPHEVQVAEGAFGEPAMKVPILEWNYAGEVQQGIIEVAGEVAGSIRVVFGTAGIWMQAWADPGRNRDELWRHLVSAGLSIIQARRKRLPIYMAVKQYQTGLDSILDHLGFAPFADHARMVRHTVQRNIERQEVRRSVLEAIPEGVTTFSQQESMQTILHDRPKT